MMYNVLSLPKQHYQRNANNIQNLLIKVYSYKVYMLQIKQIQRESYTYYLLASFSINVGKWP